jgi:hypothetical protein
MGTDCFRRKARSLAGAWPSAREWVPQQTIDAVEPAGPQLVELMALPPYHYAAIFLRAPFQGVRIVARNTS